MLQATHFPPADALLDAAFDGLLRGAQVTKAVQRAREASADTLTHAHAYAIALRHALPLLPDWADESPIASEDLAFGAYAAELGGDYTSARVLWLAVATARRGGGQAAKADVQEICAELRLDLMLRGGAASGEVIDHAARQLAALPTADAAHPQLALTLAAWLVVTGNFTEGLPMAELAAKNNEGIGRQIALLLVAFAALRLRDLPLASARLQQWEQARGGSSNDELALPFFLTLRAECCALQGDLPAARTTLAQAAKRVPDTMNGLAHIVFLSAEMMIDLYDNAFSKAERTGTFARELMAATAFTAWGQILRLPLLLLPMYQLRTLVSDQARWIEQRNDYLSRQARRGCLTRQHLVYVGYAPVNVIERHEDNSRLNAEVHKFTTPVISLALGYAFARGSPVQQRQLRLCMFAAQLLELKGTLRETVTESQNLIMQKFMAYWSAASESIADTIPLVSQYQPQTNAIQDLDSLFMFLLEIEAEFPSTAAQADTNRFVHTLHTRRLAPAGASAPWIAAALTLCAYQNPFVATESAINDLLTQQASF